MPHKRTGRRLCFWFIAPQQAAGVRVQAGAARPRQRVYTVCAWVPFAPSRQMRDRECFQVEEKVALGSGSRVKRGHSAELVAPVWQRSDVERGSWGEGGSSRGRSRRRPCAPCAQHSPLKDAGVLATQRDEVRVVVSEPDAGHVAAVATVHEAWRLGWGEGRVAGSCAALDPARPAREASPWHAHTGTGRGALCKSHRPRPPPARCGNDTES